MGWKELLKPDWRKIIIYLILLIIIPNLFFFQLSGQLLPIGDAISPLFALSIGGTLLGGQCGPDMGPCTGVQAFGGLTLYYLVLYLLSCILISAVSNRDALKVFLTTKDGKIIIIILSLGILSYILFYPQEYASMEEQRVSNCTDENIWSGLSKNALIEKCMERFNDSALFNSNSKNCGISAEALPCIEAPEKTQLVCISRCKQYRQNYEYFIPLREGKDQWTGNCTDKDTWSKVYADNSSLIGECMKQLDFSRENKVFNSTVESCDFEPKAVPCEEMPEKTRLVCIYTCKYR